MVVAAATAGAPSGRREDVFEPLSGGTEFGPSAATDGPFGEISHADPPRLGLVRADPARASQSGLSVTYVPKVPFWKMFYFNWLPAMVFR